jgi:ribonuclease J
MRKNFSDGATQIARHKNETAERAMRRYRSTKANIHQLQEGALRIVPLGGQNGIGEKNMIVVEYKNDAIILDCGFELGIALPGINYGIPVTDYLKKISHKIRGYVISHGHMDHIGGLVHILPDYPAPVYGSQFTLGMIQAQFEKREGVGEFQPDLHVMNMDTHEQIRLGEFNIELVRVTHSIPESSAIVVDTPVGRLINTGDFRLDPEPLDSMPSDIARLKQLGDEGVLLLMSESTSTTKLGRTPTEHTLQDSFYQLVGEIKGRMIIGVFSTNMNRVQMIINAAHHHGKKVVLDGRSMLMVAELAVRLGNLKIPKGVLIPMRQAHTIPDNQLVVICTGGQGEPGAVLSRMAAGEHRTLKLRKGDTVVISSTPIPGNEVSYDFIGNDLTAMGVTLYRHPTHEIDGCGPLHVSGHAARDEHAEMIRLTRPKYLMPIYGGALTREYHRGIGVQEGLKKENIIMVHNGEVIDIGRKGPQLAGRVTSGTLLVDQTGAVIPELVTRDRLLLKNDGFVVLALTVDKKSRRLLSNPDIVTRGHIEIRDNAELMDALRQQLRKLMATRGRIDSRNDIDLLKHDIKSQVGRYIFDQTGQTPIVIPIVNTV